MAEYSKLITTAKGQALIAKIIAGTATDYDFTRVVASDDEYEITDLESLTSLTEKQSADIAEKEIVNQVGVKVSTAFSNADLVEGYYMRTLGLYATDPDEGEILYAVCIETTGNCYMPPFSGTTVSGAIVNMTTYVSNSEDVTLVVDPAALVTVTMFEDLEADVNAHIASQIYGQDGVHGFRYYNDTLQVYNSSTEEWVDIETGGGIAPSNVTDLAIKIGNTKLTIKWSDPGDTIIDGQTICTWGGTKLLMKAGAYPENIRDGQVLVDNKVLDTYKTNGFEVTGLTNGTTYYFALFPYADTGAVNNNVANRISGTPQPYRTMTVIIDTTNSNPETALTYADDAEGMTAGSDDWDDFFGHYPCLLNGGVEGVHLNPDNFEKDVDGNTVTLTGASGDVMIAFPRRGVKITTVGTNIKVQMTDDPDNADFTYYAHTRGTTAKDVFYLGVYKGVESNSKLRSIKSSAPTGNKTIGAFRTLAQANGSGYENSGFYQLIFRQVMFILKYKNLDSQSVIGRGYVKSTHSTTINTGGSEAYGMDSEIIKVSNPTYMTDEEHHVKLFGLEDFWGNIWEWIDGLVSDASYNILTATDGFNDSGSGYTNKGSSGFSSNTGNYMSKPQGTSDAGFIIKEVSGSDSTYYCDYGAFYASCVAIFGGNWTHASYAGAFQLYVNNASSYAYATIGGRLMYLEPNAA
jgi:hypothetical protein